MRQLLLMTFSMFNNHPKIDIRPTAKDRRLINFGWILVALNLLLIFSFYFELPETIATHFNLKGEADGYGSKNIIWILPILNIVLYYGMTVIATKVKPWNFNYPTKVNEKNAPKLYAGAISMLVYINVGIAFLFLLVSTHVILVAKNIATINLGWLILPTVILLTVGPILTSIKMFKSPKS
ncbi:MAG: DUF1648 domain-containing protein [Croceitalea sp.]|nr:DUF1648 domain-containing protein [Croceitalea sp.]